MFAHKILVAAAALAGALAAGTAHASPDVQWQLSIETPKIRLPGHVVIPLPPIPVPRAVVVAPQREERVHGYAEPRRWDADGDGIPNRHDAYPNDPRNGRGWHERAERCRGDYWRDVHSDNRRDDRKNWRDDRRH